MANFWSLCKLYLFKKVIKLPIFEELHILHEAGKKFISLLIYLNVYFKAIYLPSKRPTAFPWRLISKFFSPLCQHRISRTVSPSCSKGAILHCIWFTSWLGTYWNLDFMNIFVSQLIHMNEKKTDTLPCQCQQPSQFTSKGNRL